MITPEEIRGQITLYLAELSKAPQAYADAERKYEQADDAYQGRLDILFLESEGNIEERKAIARINTRDLKAEMSEAKIEFDRVKHKIKQLESSLMATQSLLKSVMAEGA